MTLLRVLIVAGACFVPTIAHAVAASDAVTASSPQAAALTARVQAIEAALDERLLPRDDPASHWIAGQRARTDALFRIDQWYRAHRAAPREPLFLSSLALACVRSPLPRPAACDEGDWLAKWATSDADNALPRVWLAQRALERKDVNGAVAYVQDAAARPRFDDYGGHRAPILWAAYEPLAQGEPAAAAIAAATDLSIQASDPAPGLRVLCGTEPGGGLADANAACGELGLLMARKANTLAARDLGARLASTHAPDDAARTRAAALRTELATRLSSCSDAGARASEAMQSSDPATREIGRRVFAQWTVDLAATDELTACEREAAGLQQLRRR